MTAKADPSPAEITAACLEIQHGWTPEERMKRLRVDLRPAYTLADGRLRTMDAEDYRDHHDARAAILDTMGGP